ncbi:hypothetical protein L1987_52663 [Smallanthus sonchifolius]|uniref:Uncharacterized protein n=1 Tax=Smallanthus sonchifolius TaxID=185202 RepID=A0ACB9EUD1_9ASTR|nr:hypothetical protein L1987_52663 [Smallanthus sonchifolius]
MPPRGRGRPRGAGIATRNRFSERQTPPTPNNTIANQRTQIAQIITQQLVVAIPGIVARINSNVNPNNAIPGNANPSNINPGNANMGNAMGNNNASNAINARSNEANANFNRENNQGGIRRECTYDDFMSCKPKDFYGKGGAVRALRWIEEMESTI